MDSSTNISSVAVVIVLYHPSKADLDNAKIIAGTYRGVIADNSATPAFTDKKIGKMSYMQFGENRGIATAHNSAIRQILHEGGTSHIVLLDQDSRCNLEYPQQIANNFKHINALVPNLAALGPTVIEKDTGEEYRSAIHRDHYMTDHFIAKRDIIASGCCISTEALASIGLFDEKLFIDFVDTEWCFRARAKGYVYGTTTALRLPHKVGRGEIHFGNHIVSIAAPYRYYYQYRNFVLLLFRGYVPLWFKTNFGIKLTLRLFYIPFCVTSGASCMKNMLCGIFAGIKMLITNVKP